MNWHSKVLTALVLAAGLLAVWPDTAEAQRRGGRRGWGGNYGGGSGYYQPGSGNYGNYGYGNYGYGNRYYQGGYGYRSYYPYDGYQYEYAPNEQYMSTNTSSSMVEIRVRDANARVRIDDQEVSQMGTTRIFQTPPLEPGYTYTYRIRAESPGMGSREKTVSFQPGQRVVVDFTSSASTSQ